MKLHEKYKLEFEKYSKLDRNLYNIEIFVVCNNGDVYKGDWYDIYINPDDIVRYMGSAGVKDIPPNQIDHITYELYPMKLDNVD